MTFDQQILWLINKCVDTDKPFTLLVNPVRKSGIRSVGVSDMTCLSFYELEPTGDVYRVFADRQRLKIGQVENA